SPLHKMRISIRTPDTRCLIFSCTIPANSLRNLFLYGDPSAKWYPCSAQDMLLRSLRLLKKRRMLPMQPSATFFRGSPQKVYTRGKLLHKCAIQGFPGRGDDFLRPGTSLGNDDWSPHVRCMR